MALSEKLRSSIYRNLSPVIGEEETAAVLAHFPLTDQEDLVTKDFLRAESAEIRMEMHQSINRLLVTLVTSQIAITGLAVAILKA